MLLGKIGGERLMLDDDKTCIGILVGRRVNIRISGGRSRWWNLDTFRIDDFDGEVLQAITVLDDESEAGDMIG